MTRLIAAVRASVQSGRYVTGWTLSASFLLSFTVMAPSAEGTLTQVLLAGAATWLCVAAALIALAVTERRLVARARAIVVTIGVILIAAARPVVADAWLRAAGATPPDAWQLPFRMLTNAVTWLVVFTAIAVIVDAVRSLRTVNALLRAAVGERARVDRRTAAFDTRARAAVRSAAEDVARALPTLAGHAAPTSPGAAAPTSPGAAAPTSPGAASAPSSPGDADDVRAFATGRVRAVSHALVDLASAPLDDDDALADEFSAQRSAARHAPARQAPPGQVAVLSVPPRWAVTVIYAVCLLPFAIRAVPLTELALGAAVAVAGGALVDTVSRGRRLRHRVRVFLAASLLCAVALSLVSVLCGAPALRAVVPGVVYALIAVGAAACAGTLRALRIEQRRLSGAVAAAQRSGRAGTAPAREALAEAAELLHRDVQGRCAVFVLAHPQPTSADRAELVDEVTQTLAQVGGVFARERRAVPVSLDGIVQTWGRVIALELTVSPAARTALDAGSQAARDAYDIVAEGVLNAVKHSAQRRADVALDVVATGAGDALRVRVRSYGPLPGTAGTEAQLRPASHVAALGAVLSAGTGGAVLEAAIPLPARVAAPAVASTEHPG
ncbi:MAG: hypothetical protein J0I43_14755 [Microbacterium sp.]|uniref:hypothetical protein n=1 Tax=Microbacterium sp. TaxID=51671 RepID=UPI001AD4CB07|nr:hypothetical protein [Microbacterium sp.]MBN9178608.1 hypothetical protein [Microbacterium sp.]